MRRALLLLCVVVPASVRAAPLAISAVKAERATIHTAGVQVLISGDEDRDARIDVRFRPTGATAWVAGPPLFRVWPETVAVAVPEQFAGSLFDLQPATSYEIELHAVDPDGADLTRTITVQTRAVPRLDPDSSRLVAVTNAVQLKAALTAAVAGDVIELATGMYAGPFVLAASGTATRPIVIRGVSQTGVVLDGQGCVGCNVLEVTGSYVHVERLTLRGATRALRFLGTGTVGDVARRLTIRDVVHGIGAGTDQLDFYLCDNDLEGRLVWPWVFASDATTHWDDRGINVHGSGHVICHNRIRGFGDPVVNKQPRTRAWDVYGNDILDSFDGTELDEGEGNVRLFRNRFTNVMAPVSIQPVYGGPAYVLRNIGTNIPDEQLKLKSLGGTQFPSGAVILHNTFVSPKLALNLQTPIIQFNFVISNNLFVGPATLAGSRTVDWTAAIDGGTFDYNGYFPEGGFWFGKVGTQNRIYASFAAAQAAGVETNGVLASRPIFEGDAVGVVDPTIAQAPSAQLLTASSNALDRGEVRVGINDFYVGAGPDLGAVERGCAAPVYGPRAAGTELQPTRVSCEPPLPPTDGGTPADAGTTADAGAAADAGASADAGTVTDAGSGGGPDGGVGPPGTPSGCGCGAAPIALWALPFALIAAWRQRRAWRW